MYQLHKTDTTVSVITGIERKSRNRKTGNMLQVWHIRHDMHPIQAIKSGHDNVLCGSCPLRGDGTGKDRGCYVNVGQAPGAVYRGLDKAKAFDVELVRGRVVRWGAYGDSALSLPIEIMAQVSEVAKGWTGYTHQWRDCKPAFKQFLMASCDSEADYHEAKAAGWRTFRVKRADDPVLHNEIVCPASDEGGNKTTCAKCRLCNGTGSKSTKDIVINAHGTGAKYI